MSVALTLRLRVSATTRAAPGDRPTGTGRGHAGPNANNLLSD